MIDIPWQRYVLLLLSSLFVLAVSAQENPSAQLSSSYFVAFETPRAAENALEAFAKTVQSSAAKPTEATAIAHQLRAQAARHLVYFANAPAAFQPETLNGYVRSHSYDVELSSRSVIPSDPRYPAQWNMQRIDAAGAWEYTTGGTSANRHEVVMGVIEFNGYDVSNTDIRNQYWTNPAEVPNNNIDDDSNGYVDDVQGWNFIRGSDQFIPNLHGAHVVATMAAEGNNGDQIAGLNWEASVLPLEVGNVDHWILSVDYLTALREEFNRSLGASGAYVVVANMSFGIDTSRCTDFPLLNDAFNRAGAAGILSVGSTGNTGGFISDSAADDVASTCSSEFMIGVTASNFGDSVRADARFSSTFIDIAAPGDIYPSIRYSNSSDSFSGTSGAAPHVAGTIALLYSLDCPALDRLALRFPAEAARVVRRLLLESADKDVGDLGGKVSSGGRLNAGAAVRSVLESLCVNDELLVAFETGATSPEMLTLDDGSELVLLRSLSERWNIHLYDAPNAELDGLAARTRSLAQVVAAEPNLQLLLRSRTPSDPDYAAQEYADQLGLPEAWSLIYGESTNPSPTPVVTAVFDQNFALEAGDLDGRLYVNTAEIENNGIDDDANGFIDDARGVPLKPGSSELGFGSHGRAVTSLLAANADDGLNIAGVDWAGSVLPMRGSTLADWVRGADYAAQLRNTYNANMGSGDGALIVSYLTPQGAPRSVVDEPQVVELVAEGLLNAGILLVGAAADRSMAAADFPSAVLGDHILAATTNQPDEIVEALRSLNHTLVAPGGPYFIERIGPDTVAINGSSGAAALAAGGVALLYQSQCADYMSRAGADPSGVAREVRDVLRDAGGTSRKLDIGSAAAIAEIACSEASPCSVISLPRNAVTRSSLLDVLVSSSSTTTCPLSVVDAVGRIMAHIDQLPDGVSSQTIETSGWAAGIYFLRIGDEASSNALPISVW